jgi:hypothetical protein
MPVCKHGEDLQDACSACAEEHEEIEAVIACLGDDAAKLREKNPECEMAANMDRAAVLLAQLIKEPD